MATTLPNASRSIAADALAAAIDAGSGAGKLIYRGSGATVLVTIPLETTGFGAASNGTCTAANFPKEANASASGTVIDCVFTDDADVVIIGPIDVTEGSGANQLIETTVVSGQPVRVSSASFTVPATG